MYYFITVQHFTSSCILKLNYRRLILFDLLRKNTSLPTVFLRFNPNLFSWRGLSPNIPARKLLQLLTILFRK